MSSVIAKRFTVLRRCTIVLVWLIVSMWTVSLAKGGEVEEGQKNNLHKSLLQNLEWRNIGPGITSGRIADIAIVETDMRIIYAATATGGLWKTSNNGTTWYPIFDNEKTVSLGAVALARSNSNIVWVGTGEDFNARSNSWGNGVYKSEDAGKTWDHVGLEETRHIGDIVIHPDDPDIVFVAAMGSLWGAGKERGLFKTTDGGRTWSKSLYISEHTGVVDVAMDPREPDWLYATAFQRERRNWSFVAGGPEGGIFRSTDGGVNWNRLENGLPTGDIGRVGLSICRNQPDRIYAAVRAQGKASGIYRSEDRGASWELRTSEVATRWSYGDLYCDPNDPNRIYVLSVDTTVSSDGGKTHRTLVSGGRVHGDHRSFWIDPTHSDHLILGTDGGLYLSYDRGGSWEFMDHIPVTQFYTVAVDMRTPFYFVYGGTQDQSSYGGPSGTRHTDGITNADWFRTIRGDGFYAAIDPTDPTVVYSEAHYGRLIRFDTQTGEQHLIQPQPPEGESYRWNWSAPLLISHFDHKTVYFAANKVFKSTKRGDAWDVISPDLTRQLDHFELPLQGKLWPRDAIGLHTGTSDYGNITTLSESSIREGLLVVGTDDGLLWVTKDDGANWNKLDLFPGVPEQTRVSRVVLSRFAENTIYVTFDAHKDNNFRPFVIKSANLGKSWTSITNNLPAFGSTRVVVEGLRNPDLLFVGTEFGVFVSITGGKDWVALKNNLPTVPVHDIVLHPRENDLVIGTHGRGFWILDDVSILESLSEDVLASTSHLAPMRTATQLHRFDRGRDNLGDQFFRAPNPPNGAIITYYINPEVMSVSNTEPPTSEDGDKRNEIQQSNPIQLAIYDAQNNLISHLKIPQGSNGTGIQRVVWDLRHELPYKVTGGAGRETKRGSSFNIPYGPFVMPGDYQVRLRVNNVLYTEDVSVQSDPDISISTADRREWHDMLVELTHLQGRVRAVRRAAGQIKDQLQTVISTFKRLPNVPDTLVSDVEILFRQVSEIVRESQPQEGLFGGSMPKRFRVVDQINMVYAYMEGSTAPPTEDQKRWQRLGTKRLDQIENELTRLSAEELPALYMKLDKHGITWTPGRLIPTTQWSARRVH